MFNNHTMSVVDNLNILGANINNKDLLAVAAITTSDYPDKLPNVYNASILIPPTEILMAWADGVPYVLQYEYPKYLSSQVPDDMIVALIALMTQKDIILYIPNDEFNVFGKLLLDYIYYTYGITCNIGNVKFSVDVSKIPYIISKFYMIDVMDAKDYIAAYPANAYLPNFVINKLAEDMHPFVQPVTFDVYAEYFNRMNASKGFTVEHPSMVRVVDKL